MKAKIRLMHLIIEAYGRLLSAQECADWLRDSFHYNQRFFQVAQERKEEEISNSLGHV
jgi:hypothetical protein